MEFKKKMKVTFCFVFDAHQERYIMYDWYVLLSPVPFCMHHRYSNKSYGVVILCDTETDQKWAVNNCVEVFIL